jgi:translation initiation factor IF-2
MFRVKNLAVLLKLAPKKVLKDFTLRHRKKYFCKFDNVWFQFGSTKDLIISYNSAKLYAEKNEKILEEPLNIEKLSTELQLRSKTTKRIPVAVILGHYNHGKTTLLDALGNTDIVSLETEGITQVIICYD